MVIGCRDTGDVIIANVGVFFTEIVINCGCGDDPYETNAYCELDVTIDKSSGKTRFAIAAD